MGKPTRKKKPQPVVEKPTKQNKSSKQIDEDVEVFIQMSQEIKEEGNKLFQKQDSEGAMLKYEKALKLLPNNHIDMAYLRNKMADCYMKLGLKEYPRAIFECNLALEVAPKYSKALLNRARCYLALNKFDWALKDVGNVLSMEPNNLSALEIDGSLRRVIEGKRLMGEEVGVLELIEPEKVNVVTGNVTKKKKKKKDVEKVVLEDKSCEKSVEEEEKMATKTVKMVFGDDIRWAELPVNCGIGLMREIISDRFPGLDGVLIKYKDQEGDLITIVTTNELRLAENSSDSGESFRLYLVEVSTDEEPVYEGFKTERFAYTYTSKSSISAVGKNEDFVKGGVNGAEEWIVEFARLFKNHVGFDTNPYLDLHELGMELYTEAMKDTIPNKTSQNLFDIAGEKFQETSALALFNWGNVHMNKARKWVALAEDATRESVTQQVKLGYEWAQKEYIKAGKRYEESLKIKPDFYEGHLALGQQQFEQAKLTWHYAIGSKADLEGRSVQILELYNKSEDNMEKGMQIWEELEEARLNGLGLSDKYKAELANLGLEGMIKDISSDEATQQTINIRSQINIFWGTILYERSVVEYKLSLPSWEECLEVAVEKFELAGASLTDIAVIIKNHCSNGTTLEGLSFKIDEIVQAWNEMFDTKRWQTGLPSFRLEPLFRRRMSKLHSLMEHF